MLGETPAPGTDTQKLQAKAGEVELEVSRPRRLPFETRIKGVAEEYVVGGDSVGGQRAAMRGRRRSRLPQQTRKLFIGRS